MAESVQKWLERNRAPRVKITYEVETGGAIEKQELPFIVGIFADLAGDRNLDVEFPPYKLRQMVPIDRDLFNDVMKTQLPRVALGRVPRIPSPPGATPIGAVDSVNLSGDIAFNSLDAFDPIAIVRAIPDLNKLYRVRSNIRMLQSRAESSDRLNDQLNLLIAKTPDGLAKRTQLQVLAGPDYRNSVVKADLDKAPGELKKATTSLYDLAMVMGKPDQAAKLKAATDWSYDTVNSVGADGKSVVDADATLAPLRRLLGIFAVPDTPENLQTVSAQLQQLTQWDNGLSTKIQTERNAVVVNLGADPKDVPTQTKLKADATALLAALVPKDDQIDPDAKRAALAVLGIQQTDDSDSIAMPADAAQVRTAAEQKHDAVNRRVANNLLLSLTGATDTPDPKAKPIPPTKKATRQSIDAVFALMDAAGLKTDEDRQKFLGSIGFFVTDVLVRLDAPGSTYAPVAAITAIDSHISNIDSWLSRQLSVIMHAPKFQEVEATWRGLHYFVSNTETGKMLKLSVFNATKDELLDDMEKAVDKDQSKLFKMIYEDQYGTFGGLPYSLLVGGYEVGRGAKDIEFLRKIAEVAASAHAPYITAASASLFGLDSFRDLGKPRDLEKIFESIELAGWQEFRESEDSRYVTLVMPHVLLRLPYGKDSWPVDGMDFEETVGPSTSSPDSGSFLWGNAAYMLAQRVTNAFSKYNWTAAIRGVEGGGLVEDLPTYSFRTDSGAEELFCPTEVSITDRREKELNDLGFISLCHCKGKGQAAFFGGQTSNQPKKYFSDSANANAQISALLPYMLAASRFAHYIKVIMRAKVGSFLTRGNVEAYLNTWISNYVLLDENASQDAKASFPLSQANVIVKDVPGAVGSYNAVVFLRPHFQLEELTTSIRLVANLPK